MTELINSLKSFASATTASAISEVGRRQSIICQTETRASPLMTLGRTDSCSESGFNQWRDAMRMVARLPGGLPPEFRLRLWENLADRYLTVHGIDWTKIVNRCNYGNARDSEIADQIEKDLHRTGCTGFSGAKQAVLKQVLVSYARWNPAVGYCQGFNMIGAMLLQMTSGNERLTLKILIFLIEGVLPEGYFSQGLRGLAVDMAVFREILKLRKPTLNAHLSRLQKRDDSPPLTDVFTMHWFLTLFIHCLPPNSVFRVWDLVLLEGSEVLLRAALVLWAAIETRVLCVSSTDEFYSVMGVATREMLEFGLMDPNSLVKCIVSVGPFPFPGLADLRLKHRALISQDTPHKSFFLAKKELDALKRHYAAIRHRQRATTVILKGLETKYGRSCRSSLVVPTKRQVVSSPKVRRQAPATRPSLPPPKQVTVTWDKAPKKPKNFRKRRTSASSHTTDSSSSTELCDSSSEAEDGVWLDPPPDPTPDPPVHANAPEPPKIEITPREKSFDETEAELLLLTESTESSEAPNKCIDTNDSQHFLEEMSRLGKSDSFYESLSVRICELQFQNLQILTSVNTAGDKENSFLTRQPFELSPLPSPISPVPESLLGIGIGTRNHLSPRGSVSSNCESPLPRSPLSPSPDPNYLNILMSRKGSKSSLSSVDNEGPDTSADQKGLDLGLNVAFFPSLPTSEHLLGSEPANMQYLFSTTRTPSNQSLNRLLFPEEDNTRPEEDALDLEPESQPDPAPEPAGTESAQTTEEINAVIRENIAILQRLKLKPAAEDGDGTEGGDYYETESSDSEPPPPAARATYSRQSSGGSLKGLKRSGSGNRGSPSRPAATCDCKLQSTAKPKKQFNPFPTTRRARVKTSKFGLYN